RNGNDNMMTVKPYNRNTLPVNITAAASDLGDVENVELWHRHSADNSTWGNWRLFGIDENGTDNWAWQFTALDSNGHRQFYSVTAARNAEY
ncbi:MAG: hypothetical protein AB1305_05655, partial [Candidatus Hadarchaeota archaeon]